MLRFQPARFFARSRGSVQAVLAALLLTAAGGLTPAFAQEDPEAEGAGGPGDLLDDGLVVREKAPAPVLDDPDAKLLEEVNLKKATFEETLNKLATASNAFAEIDKAVNALTSQGLKAMDDYFETHRTELDAYRKAISEEDAKGKKAHGEAVVKVRKKYLTEIGKVQKGADKLKEKADKLQAKIDSGKAVLADEGAAEEGAAKEEGKE